MFRNIDENFSTLWFVNSYFPAMRIPTLYNNQSTFSLGRLTWSNLKLGSAMMGITSTLDMLE
jgi:hypothetical protein